MTYHLKSRCLFSQNTMLNAKGLQEFFLEAMQKTLMVLVTFPQGPEGGVITWGCAWKQSREKLWPCYYYLSTELYENYFPSN